MMIKAPYPNGEPYNFELIKKIETSFSKKCHLISPSQSQLFEYWVL